MKTIELSLPDMSDHPPPPQVDLGTFESWVRGDAATKTRASMTDEEIIADFMRNEGRQTEPWPDFGAVSELR
ncbi:hypothetical protein OKA04_02685 [Luteolibacter flavescens]|uniref:Uncharacterized protein n=1 Tax=Luteolibacter flavescens TaxID=1859460 RepID=A0ABT3FJ68_9BACT|nr:hypothetical protein [Luteolibacter flavescens]MCW1883617.1 hypothetical protein [Luteolibacter flavescens]